MKLYFSVGDNGTSVMTKEGKRIHLPNTGCVLRCNFDGAELEVFATGLRNPQEIAFDQYGYLFSVDNDGDLEDERERFVYIVVHRKQIVHRAVVIGLYAASHTRNTGAAG